MAYPKDYKGTTEMPKRKRGKPPGESMEIVVARTWERLGKVAVRLDWSVWDDLYGVWRIVPTYHKTLEQPSPAAMHRMRWRLLNELDKIEKEMNNEPE